MAMESESQVIDISRVSGFMQKVRVGCTVLVGGALMIDTGPCAGSEWCDIADRDPEFERAKDRHTDMPSRQRCRYLLARSVVHVSD